MRSRGFAAAIGLVFVTSTAAADFKEDFKKGMEAADQKRWEEAATHFRDAIAKNPTESDERVFLSGVFSTPYLPHFQLGRSLYLSSRENCPEALAEWALSEKHGAIHGFGKFQDELATGRQECNRLLLPKAIAIATSAIEKAAAALQGLPAPLLDEAHESQRLTAIDRLQQAREDLDQGESASDLAVIQSAGDSALAVSAELERWTPIEERQDVEAVPAATPVAAESTRASAEGELNTLDSPATDARTQAAEAPSATLPGASAGPTEPIAAPAAAAEDGSVAIRLGRLIADAEALLDSTAAQVAGSDLLTAQHARLKSILARAQRAESAAMAELSERISACMTVIRLVSAAHSLFTGQPERAIQILGEAELQPEPVAAHGHLLKAAARFALSRRQADGDSSLLAVAARDVRRASELDPSLRPDPAMFSPAFRAFFQARAAAPRASAESQNR